MHDQVALGEEGENGGGHARTRVPAAVQPCTGISRNPSPSVTTVPALLPVK